MRKPAQILKDLKLKATPCRESVLTLFSQNSHALSHAFIEKHTAENFDRVTVYRTLKSFEEKGLIHKVIDDNSVTKYALCHDCEIDHHHDQHVHFKCQQCGKTTCIESIEIPSIKLPNGYSISDKNLLITGVCQHCNQ